MRSSAIFRPLSLLPGRPVSGMQPWFAWSILCAVLGLNGAAAAAWQTGSVNPVALVHVTVEVGNGENVPDGTLLLRDGLIQQIGRDITVPDDARIIDGKGLRVYPGLIDALAEHPGTTAGGETGPVKPLFADATLSNGFSDEPTRQRWRSAGVLAANVAPNKGIIRGTSAVWNLGGSKTNQVVRSPVAMNVSLRGLGYRNRVPGMGEPGGVFPTRFIGVFGFVRQTIFDARYLREVRAAGKDVPAALSDANVQPSLDALAAVVAGTMPAILPASADRELRRTVQLAEELGIDPILAGAHGAADYAEQLGVKRVPVLFSLNFPDREKLDVHPEFRVPLRVLHDWQEAPRAAAVLARAGVPLAFYSDGLTQGSEFLAGLRRVVRAGLAADAALRSATLGAAEILGVQDRLGSVEAGKIANLIVTDGDLFSDRTGIRMVFVAGQLYEADPQAGPWLVDSRADRLSDEIPDPFDEFTSDSGSVVLIRNVNVMTVSHGTHKETSLLIRDGKIAALGPNLPVPVDARVIDGTGKWITPGFIDCHSHIATDSHNDSGANITSLAGTGDTINPVDIPIYRTLATGVTAANVLHGSVNLIGGQTVVIKNRWGRPADEMIVKGAKPGLKFAIKEFHSRRGVSPPSSLMGDEAFLRDAFIRARQYGQAWDDYKARRAADRDPDPGLPPRRDLTLEPLVEIMRGERYLHVHCYTPEEISVVMRVAEEFGFTVRVFQHATRGYKVAAEIARHGGSGASIFADIGDANPYNAAIMTRHGVVVSVNSDGESLARHFNQDIARLRKFGDLSEDEALALITLNPAKQLGIDDRVGSIDPGKDADLVLFNEYPLSVYAVPEMVFIDGRVYYSRDAERRREQLVLSTERALAAHDREMADAR